jgi:hypothetical protein
VAPLAAASKTANDQYTAAQNNMKAVTAQVAAAPKQVELRAAVKAAAAKAEADRVLRDRAQAELKGLSQRVDWLKAVLTVAKK